MIVWRSPSSKIVKSSALSPDTKWPLESVTVALTLTSSTDDLNENPCSAGRRSWARRLLPSTVATTPHTTTGRRVIQLDMVVSNFSEDGVPRTAHVAKGRALPGP